MVEAVGEAGIAEEEDKTLVTACMIGGAEGTGDNSRIDATRREMDWP
jgi:hypothetical protein